MSASMLGPSKRGVLLTRWMSIPLIILTLLSIVLTTALWYVSSSSRRRQADRVNAVEKLQDAPAQPAASINTAICICGTTRTFHEDAVHDSISRHLIAPYRRLGSVTVFAVLRYDDDAAPGRRQGVTRVEATKRALRKLHIDHVTEFDDDVDARSFGRAVNKTEKLPVRIRAPAQCRAEKMADLSHTLLRTQDCLREVVKHEERTGRMFDWIIRTRFDVAFLNDVPTPSLARSMTPTPNKSSRAWWHFWKKDNTHVGEVEQDVDDLSALHWDRFYTSRTSAQFTRRFEEYLTKTRGKGDKRIFCGDGMSDHVFLTSRTQASIAMNAWSVIDDCEFYHLPLANVESGLRLFLYKHGIVPHALSSLHWATVREGLGPECHKTRVLDSRQLPWPNATRECLRFGRLTRGVFPDGEFAKKNESVVDDFSVSRLHVPPRQKYEFVRPQC